MSFAGDLSRAIRDVMLYRERIDQLRSALAGIAGDLTALSKDHATLDSRVSRIEGFLDGASAAASRPAPAATRPKRLPRRTS